MIEVPGFQLEINYACRRRKDCVPESSLGKGFDFADNGIIEMV